MIMPRLEWFDYLHDGESEVLRDEPVGELSSTDDDDVWSIDGANWIRGSVKGVPSNSAHPPLRPISTTRSSILSSSSFLIFPAFSCITNTRRV